MSISPKAITVHKSKRNKQLNKVEQIILTDFGDIFKYSWFKYFLTYLQQSKPRKLYNYMICQLCNIKGK